MRRQRAWGPGARAALGPGGGAHSRLQYGVSKNQPPDDRRIRSAVPQSWRRRRYLLAAAGSRRHVGIQPSRRGLASPSQFRSRLLEAATGLHRGRGPAGKEMARTVQQRRPRQLGRPDLRQGPSADARRAEPHLSGHLGQRTVSGARPAQAWRAPVPPAATRVVSAHRCPGDAVGRRAGVGTAAFRPADPHARRRRAHPAGWPWRGASLLQQRPSVSPHEPEAERPASAARDRERRARRPLRARAGEAGQGPPTAEPSATRHFPVPETTARSFQGAPLVTINDFPLYRRLLDETRPYRLHIVGVFVLSLLASPLALLTPVPLKVAVDSVLDSHPVPHALDALLPPAATSSHTAILIVTTVMVVVLLAQLQMLLMTLLSTYVGERMVLNFRAQLFRHIQRLSVSYHDERGTTYSTYRIQYDAQAIEYIAVQGFIPFITAAVTLVLMLYIILRIDWQLGLVALAVSPLLFMLAQIYRHRMRRQSREAKELETSALSIAQEVLAALRVVKAFGQEDREHERFVGRSTQGMRARIHLAFLEGSFALLVGLVGALGTGAVLFIGIRHVQWQILTLGDLLLVMGYLTQLYSPLKTMSKRMTDIQSWLASAERAFSLLDEGQDVPERPGARPIPHRPAAALAFREVSFAYLDRFPVLRDLSFEIEPHTRLGIAGLTGSGKTTLVSLLLRFYDPDSGQLLLDGRDLRDYKLADLRNQYALVLQEPVLFSASIAENIAYARPDASYEQIVAAAEAASAREFVTRLPDGFDTQVGERGMRLSGGERQRLALARAFLKDAPILILAEPTSSVDPRTEAMIIEALERLMRDRTTILISHRESTLEPCDVRIQLEGGEIVARAGI